MQTDRSQTSRRTWRRTATRALCLLAVAASLGGCVIYPVGYGPHWHPWHGGYYRY